MNYRDFFKNKRHTAEDIKKLMPEGVDPKEFETGIGHEKEHTDDEFIAAKIAGDHLKEDPKYYSKLDAAGLEEEEQEEHCGACKDDMGGEEYDDFNDGLPKLGGALAVPHIGKPIHMAKIIQVGNEFGKGPASGAVSGMSTCKGKEGGVTKDQGGIPANQEGDKEPITAGGKKVDSSIATKSVGGAVSPGDGQKQGGPNSQGTIASTPKMNEQKEKVRQQIKEALMKKIHFNKATGKWEKITENTVNMKMGPSYKVVQPNLMQTAEKDWARSNQYDPEITEMYDEEEEAKMNERYASLMNAPRNLSETELAEMKDLREKLDRIQARNFGASPGGLEPNLYDEKKGLSEQEPEWDPQGYDTEDPVPPEAPDTEIDPDDMDECRDAAMKMGPSYRVVAPQQARCLDCDQAHRNQDTPTSTNEAGGMAVQHSSYRTANDAPQIPKNRHEGDIDEGEKKSSKAVKTIKKGQKTKKNIPSKLKHEQPRHTTSGVHKRKT